MTNCSEQVNYDIKSLIKSLKLLEILIEGGEMSIFQLSRTANMGKSTVHRILGTFRGMGYVGQKPDDGKYYATIKIFELGNRIASRLPIRSIAKPYIEELFVKCSETVNLAVLDKGDIVFLEKITTKEPLRIDLEVGRRVPVYCSGLGKALLAYDRSIKLDTFEFIQYTPATITSVEKLEQELEIIRSRGYSLDREEYIKGLLCIAVPILSRTGDIIAALSIAMPTLRSDEEKIKLYIEYLKDTAQRISDNLT